MLLDLNQCSTPGVLASACRQDLRLSPLPIGCPRPMRHGDMVLHISNRMLRLRDQHNGDQRVQPCMYFVANIEECKSKQDFLSAGQVCLYKSSFVWERLVRAVGEGQLDWVD